LTTNTLLSWNLLCTLHAHMAQTKDALRRYKVLDSCLSNTGRRYFIEDLMAACTDALEGIGAANSISRRTIFNDLEFMEGHYKDVGIERVQDGKRKYYRYSDPNFSIFKTPLNQGELTLLQQATETLRKYSGMPWVPELIQKLEVKLGIAAGGDTIVQFDENPDYSGLVYLDRLFNAVNNKEVIEIFYQDFRSDNPYVVKIHPYLLKEYKNRWFLLGRKDDTDFPTYNMALDRIREIRTTRTTYKASTVDWRDFFEQIIGVSVPEGVPSQKIRLRFRPERAKYILTKPIHGSQRNYTMQDGSLEVELDLIPNLEFIAEILQYGADVKVLSPVELAEKIKDQLQKALDLYSA